MQNPEFERIPEELAEAIADHLGDLHTQHTKRETEILREQLKQMNKDGRLFGLTEDESACLLAYREWKLSPACATGVFHWRKK